MSQSTALLTRFEKQIQRFNRRIDTLTAMSRRYSWIRLAAFLVGSGITWAAFDWLGAAAGWISAGIALIVFVAAIRIHRRINATIAQHKLWRQIKAAQVARLQLDWKRIPMVGDFAARAEHPFEADLDLTGARSLHHLLNTAVSYDGSARLRAWLTNTDPTINDIQRRQGLIRELAAMPRFRDRLILNSRITSDQLGAHHGTAANC